MSPLGKLRPPHLSRPWFAALAATVGGSTMAFGAFIIENPKAFSGTAVPAEPASATPVAARKIHSTPATVEREIPTIYLDPVRIVGNATHPRTQKPSTSNACASGWQTLNMGPESQQVREFCQPPDGAPISRTVSRQPNSPAQRPTEPPQS